MGVYNARAGDRVAYEDMANPYQEGVVTEVLRHRAGTLIMFGVQYRVAFEAVECRYGEEYGLPARETITDLAQRGWRRVGVRA